MDLQTDLGPDPSQVARARHLVATGLAASGVGGDPHEVTVLLVSELVTNALRHGRPPVRLRARTIGGALRVEVFDGDADGFPTLRDIRPDLPGGRGLQLVAALADRWGTETVDDGKSVWFELDLGP